MSIADHEAVLLRASLDQARVNKASDTNKIEFYAVFAFPPSAMADLAEAMKAVTPANSLAGMKLAVKENRATNKPYPGIPDDWLIVRTTTGPDYPPDLFAQDGAKVAALPINAAQIRSEFYAGQNVRVNGYPFFWTHDKTHSKGVSWTLSGVMAVGGGTLRPGGAGGETSESAFAQYRPTAGAQGSQNSDNQSAGAAANNGGGGGGGANPFQQSGNRGAEGGNRNNANPFA